MSVEGRDEGEGAWDVMDIDEAIPISTPTSTSSTSLAREFLEKLRGYPFNAYPPNTLLMLQQSLEQVRSNRVSDV
ncbi:hypothetical protein EON63_24110 [archaeon]|nr:MAG: hypothetical protein EON63_24110 [archaeon]